MSFLCDPNKQTQKAVFGKKINKKYDAPLVFNKNNVSESNSQKHLGVVLDNYLSFWGTNKNDIKQS